MQDGKIIEEGNVYDVFANPQKPLTKDFVNSILQFDLPERLLEERKGKIIKIYFQGAIAEQSVISDVFQKFKVRGNILHGKIEYIQDVPLGIFIMEVSGDKNEIDHAIDYIGTRTKNLEVIHDAA